MTAETYSDIGKILRESREALGLDIYTVADNIRVRAKYLAAIEDGNLADLPGKAYIKAYILSYADYLRLDRKLISQAVEALDSAKQTMRVQFMAPTSINNSPGRNVLLASLGMVFILYVYSFAMLRHAPAPDAYAVSDIPAEYQAILDKKEGKEPAKEDKPAVSGSAATNPCLNTFNNELPVGCKDAASKPNQKTSDAPTSVMDVTGSKKNYLKPVSR